MHFSGANTADFGKLHLGYGVFFWGGGGQRDTFVSYLHFKQSVKRK